MTDRQKDRETERQQEE